MFDKFRLGVKSFALAEGTEDPEVGNRIGARGRRPLPAAVVGRQITVDQFFHKILFALSPIDQQVLRQKHRRHHPQTIMHPTRLVQLPHAGVNDGVAGLPGLPSLEIFLR